MAQRQQKTIKKLEKQHLLIVTGAVFLSIVAGFIGGWLGASSHSQQAQITNEQQSKQVVLREGEVISNIAEEVGQSVVSVNVITTGSGRDPFGFPEPRQRESAGTGFILNEEGIVLTNRHVVPAGVDRVSVTLDDGTELEDVEVLGRTISSDPLDIAFLKINDSKGKTLKPVTLGDSADTEVGEKVVAIGNALGQFQNTVTSGIISGHGRNVRAFDASGSDTLENLFQTDAAVNQGNSGGPLVNIHGEVIAVTTAVAGGAENIGFAIPINDVKGLIETVLETGEVQRPFLGVRYLQLTDDIAGQENLSVNRGAYIVPSDSSDPSVVPGSAADEAGLREGDVITRVNGQDINEDNSLVSLIGRHRVGEEVTLSVVRGEETLELTATLQAAPTD